MNIAGVVKDWILIGLSVLMYKSPVTATNLGGFTIAFLGVAYYNLSKLQSIKPIPPSGDKDGGGGANK